MPSPCCRLPAADRPHFITIYYSEPDHEGHEFGPDAPETRAAALKMDAMIGKLKAALDATGLPIDLVVVSDHGMAKTEGGWITLDQFADLTGFETAGPLLYGKTEEDRARVYNQLKKASSQFVVYRLQGRAGRAELQPESARGRSGGDGHGAVCRSAPTRRRRAAGPSADRRHARLRSGTSAGDEGQLFCRRTGYREGKNRCAL